jgi:hypothetical protein
MKTKTRALNLSLFVLVASVASIANANECLMDWYTKSAPIVGKSDSAAVSDTQASNTWEDWVWRGPTFYCNPTGGDCSYTWSKANTAGYSWAVGVKIGLKDIPVVGSAIDSFDINGTYTRTKSWTETFGWSQTIRRGQYAQPVQVVVRRWTQGHFRGADRIIKGSNCSDGGTWYYWDGQATFGTWSADLETSRYAKYHIYSK